MIYDEIAEIFSRRGWTIKLEDGRMVTPTALDIEEIADGAVQVLMENKEKLNQIEVARLIVQKNGQHFDLYVHLGEI